ncbi:hypothetical protein C8J56DRAFT_893585 [Mycena floridula]|nr:hypothetical protein C8J56DRAFT_893585 [Mycena floridula]
MLQRKPQRLIRPFQPHVRGLQEKPWEKAYCRWKNVLRLLQFIYSKDLSPWTGPLVYLDHSPSFVALECDNEDSFCDFYAATYMRGILAGSYQQTIEWIYDDFLSRHPQYRLGRLFGIDIMLVSQEMIVRRGQHIDFLADYLWRYCNQGEPGFRAAGLIRFMHQWHLHYPGAFSSWIEGQADVTPQEEDAWTLSRHLQHWDSPRLFYSSNDSQAGISPQEEEAWNDAHDSQPRIQRETRPTLRPQPYTFRQPRYPRTKRQMSVVCTDNELYHRFLQERADSYIIAKGKGRQALQSFLDRTDLHWSLSFDLPNGLGDAEAASHQRWRQQYIREGLETISQRRLFFRRKAKELNGGLTPSPRKPPKPRPAYKIYTSANPTPSPIRRLRIQAGIHPVLRIPLKASSQSSPLSKPSVHRKASSPLPSSSPLKPVAAEFSSSPLRESSPTASLLPSSPLPSSSPVAYSSPSTSPFSSPLTPSSVHISLSSKSVLTLPSFDIGSLPETPTRLPSRLRLKKEYSQLKTLWAPLAFAGKVPDPSPKFIYPLGELVTPYHILFSNGTHDPPAVRSRAMEIPVPLIRTLKSPQIWSVHKGIVPGIYTRSALKEFYDHASCSTQPPAGVLCSDLATAINAYLNAACYQRLIMKGTGDKAEITMGMTMGPLATGRNYSSDEEEY